MCACYYIIIIIFYLGSNSGQSKSPYYHLGNLLDEASMMIMMMKMISNFLIAQQCFIVLVLLKFPNLWNFNRSSTDVEPQTTPPPFKEPKRRQHGNAKSSLQQKILAVADLISILRNSSETDFLWRKSRKPLSRTARKRRKYENLLPFFH